MILVIDNYDSFTWNLVQCLRGLGTETSVLRNDQATPAQVSEGGYAGIVISPGPGRPEGTGICREVVNELAGVVPLLGVCLGMQVMARVAGAAIRRAPRPVHGKATAIHHDGRGVFRGLPSPFQAARYHSLVVDPETLPQAMEVSAWSSDGLIMGLRASGGAAAPQEGIQFHPESILTPRGRQLVENFCRSCSRWQEEGPRRAHAAEAAL